MMTRELPVTRGRAQIHNLGYALLLTRTGAITVVLGYEITAGLLSLVIALGMDEWCWQVAGAIYHTI